MKKLHLVLSILFASQLLSAQLFTEKFGVPFSPVSGGSIAFADIDGDNDEDVLITGSTKAILYTNDGAGNYTEVTETSFVGVSNSAIAFADVDGDNDQDVLITGFGNSIGPTTKLYINDGTGAFTEMTGTSFENVEHGTVDFVDVDSDNDLDVFITGNNGDLQLPYISELYLNDGAGNFTDSQVNNFWGIESGAIIFSDIDGDNDQDLVLTGMRGASTNLKFIYMNDGQGNFSSVNQTGLFGPMWHCSIVFCDVDGDNDQDAIATGSDNLGLLSELYINDGTGNYTQRATPFEAVAFSSTAVSDIDNDNDLDVLITGFNAASTPTAKLYTNDGMGNFTELNGLPFTGVGVSSVAFSDIDGDNDEDLLITGVHSNDIAKLYINNLVTSNDNSSSKEFQFDFSVFPNPSTSNKINISFESEEYGELTINIYDLKGRLIQQQMEQLEYGKLVFPIDLTLFAQGDYLLELDNGKRKSAQIFSIQ